MRSVILLVIIGTAACTFRLTAQDVSGSMQGKILNSSGQPQPGVLVTVSGQHLMGTRTTTTDGSGGFQLLALPPGEYAVRIRAIGMRPVTVEHVVVELGRTTLVQPVTLESQPVELTPINIVAPMQSVDPVHTDAGGRLTSAEYDALPGERDYKAIMTILPNVNESSRGDPANVNGATGLENMYFIDGVNVTSGLRAQTGTSLPYNFVRAVEVKTGGYEAQYGKALGAVVNAVTYSGTNDFEVNVFAFGTSSAFEATPKVLPTLRETGGRSYDVGVRVSGPVVRDRLWYSAAYNPRLEHVDREIQGLGVFPDKQTAQVFAGKLTWQATRATHVEFSVFGDPTVHDAVVRVPTVPASYVPLNADPFLRRFETGGVIGSARFTAAVGDHVLLEGSLSRSSGRDNVLPATEVGRTEPFLQDNVDATVSGGTPLQLTSDIRRSSATVHATATLARHTAVIGVEYEDVGVTNENSHPGGYSILRLDSATYQTTTEGAPSKNHNRIPTAYVQDTWQLTDRLTFNAGVRWSSQTLTGTSGKVAQRFADEWQPRLGLIWQLGRPGTQRVFASYGRFYQQEPLNLSALWFVDYPFVISHYSVDPRQPGAMPTSVADYTTYEADWDKNIPDLQVENSYEFTLGYERTIGSSTKLTLRGVRRQLHSSFQWGIDPNNPAFWVLGTPGKGDFAFLPKPLRQYTALELEAVGQWHGVAYRGSYVLSRSWGNYPGLYMSDYGAANPGGDWTFFAPHQAVNSTGLLPNDHTHVLKLAVRYQAHFGLTAGAVVSWESGVPRNEFAPGPPGTLYYTWAFVVPRGSVGRTPSVWDLNLRLGYDMRWWHGPRSRIFLDALHVGNPQRPVWLEEQRYLQNDGTTFSGDNPSYGGPLAYQPPRMARLGLEVEF